MQNWSPENNLYIKRFRIISGLPKSLISWHGFYSVPFMVLKELLSALNILVSVAGQSKSCDKETHHPPKMSPNISSTPFRYALHQSILSQRGGAVTPTTQSFSLHRKCVLYGYSIVNNCVTFVWLKAHLDKTPSGQNAKHFWFCPLSPSNSLIHLII